MREILFRACRLCILRASLTNGRKRLGENLNPDASPSTTNTNKTVVAFALTLNDLTV